MTEKKIGAYTLIRSMGQGGMAEVWLARKPGLLGTNKLVVIKRILPHQTENRSFIEAFVDEARLAIRLRHPNIVQVHDIGEFREQPFLVLELVDGTDLERLLGAVRQTGDRLPIRIAVGIATDLSRALHYAHTLADEAGQPLQVIHRDVSPPNVLLSRRGEVKLGDFGIAKARGRLAKTAFGVLKGKAPYVSPEQAKGLPLDHRSDQFSVGVVLWECLIGQRLFDGDDDFATLRLVKSAHVPPPSSRRKEIGAELDAIVLRLLAAEPKDRFADAGAAALALASTCWHRDFQADELGALVAKHAAKSPADIPSRTDSLDLNEDEEPFTDSNLLPRRRNTWPWLVSMLILLLVLAAGLLWVELRQTNPHEPLAASADLGEATLIVAPDTDGSVVFWDRDALGPAPRSEHFPLDGKPHELLMMRPGYQPWRRTIHFRRPRTIDAGQSLLRQMGAIAVPENSDEEWRVAGQTVTPGEKLTLPAGTYLTENSYGEQNLVNVTVNQTQLLRSGIKKAEPTVN